MKLKILFVLMLMIVPAYAQDNDCEKLAKDYQQEHGGDLIMVQPLKDNGAYDLGEYNAHMINYVYTKGTAGQYHYYDKQFERYMDNKTEVKEIFELMWSKKVVVLNINRGEVPFAIQWHY